MNNINVGDIVVFSTGGGLKTNIGMILKHKDNGNYVVLTKYSSAYKDIQVEWIATLDKIESVRKEVTEHYTEKINELQSKIKKVTSEEKQAYKIERYNELQKEIKVVAKRLSESEDDADFENRLKAISDMRKCLYSIELECVSDTRKDNGKIKWEIRNMHKTMESELTKIDDKNLTEAFNF